MKETKKTIPIFVPHKGCPNDCIFCNQKKITGIEKEQTREEIISNIEAALGTIKEDHHVEIAFFGGSFTAIPIEKQIELLEIAKTYIDLGKVDEIRVSTRPDAIDQARLDLLKKYGVTIVELGVQSMDEKILRDANRGHNTACVFESSSLIKANGLRLGLQMMIGLPGDSEEKVKRTVEQFIGIGPEFVRIYPVLVIKETELEDLLERGLYKPWPLERAVESAKDAYLAFTRSGIKVIRIGLQASDTIAQGADLVDGPFHPAFGELVISLAYRDLIENQITVEKPFQNSEGIRIRSPKKHISKLIGNKKSNKRYFKEKYQLDMSIQESSGEELLINETKIEILS